MRAAPILLAVAVGAFGQASRDLQYESGNGRRLALIVGNEAYAKWPLRNPVNDARAVEQALRELGFETEAVVNAGLKALEQGVDRFVAKVKAGDVAMFYYAGHGIQIDGENYLVPVDFDAKDEADAKYVSYSAARVQERMDRAGARLSIVVLDACRNNPFRTTRSAGGG
ncbi:MAG: caspase family protein, partial [Bryobacterales bacterium]|nr:caspase family protein [Bryobacterales bacterium]